ncbi:hypothetical protein, partial [Peribacillus sp. NPDC060253]|uniref:hypothetical protein n=1 Tax=Peribacillus sp. NPDC060253 TaxID=3347084 RepID=UPI003669D640
IISNFNKYILLTCIKINKDMTPFAHTHILPINDAKYASKNMINSKNVDYGEYACYFTKDRF